MYGGLTEVFMQAYLASEHATGAFEVMLYLVREEADTASP